MAEAEADVLGSSASDVVDTPEEKQQSKPEDLVARAIAPIKTEFLRAPPLRSCCSSLPLRGNGIDGNTKINGAKTNDKAERKETGVFGKEKKSRRQLKRERQQEQKSVRNICPEIAKARDVSACRFGGSCRFSHDLDGFLAQKPEDLPGSCPFIDIGKSCPYGVTCRFSGTHSEGISPEAPSVPGRKNSELNGLSKDVQRLLWKNKYKFPKADAQLKLLGLTKGKYAKEEAEKVDCPSVNGSSTLLEVEGGEPLSTLDEAILLKGKYAEEESEKVDSPSVNGPSTLLEVEGGEPLSTLDEAGPNERISDDHLEDDAGVEELRPPKKAKVPADEECNATEINNSLSFADCEEHTHAELDKDISDQNPHPSKVEVIPTLNIRERKLIDFRNKLYLAPLTTVGNLPFRRVSKVLGADITCGEMAMCTNLLQGQASEWALLRRHSSEDVFGVQICGAYPDTVARTVELIDRECTVDFIDINMGCPIDIVVNKGAGSSLLTKPMRMKNIIQAACGTVDKPLTVKVRTGYIEGRNRVDSLIADISQWGASAITVHGRSRQQRYSKLADWDYINLCAGKAPESLQVLGNGDIFSYHDWNKHKSYCPQLSSCMIARGALIKPWIFTEIKEERLWDISSGERFDILKKFVHFGLEHWGCDSKGLETTRHFLLEWLSYTYRYIPVGLLDVIPQRLNWRPPSYYGRNDLETLMVSDSAADWIRISEMLLGKVPDGFSFAPKHKSNAYDRSENG